MSCSGRDVSGFGSSIGNSKGHFMIASGLWPGALGGTRTPNLLIRSQMLYPLSYERSHCSILHSKPSLFAPDIRAQRYSADRASDFRFTRRVGVRVGLQDSRPGPFPRTAVRMCQTPPAEGSDYLSPGHRDESVHHTSHSLTAVTTVRRMSSSYELSPHDWNGNRSLQSPGRSHCGSGDATGSAASGPPIRSWKSSGRSRTK
jgi:hypothetical protein